MADNSTTSSTAWQPGKGAGMEFKFWSRRARMAPIAILALSGLILLAMSALDRFHAHQFEQSVHQLHDFDQTRSSLQNSLQRLRVGLEPVGVSELEMERDTLVQNLQALRTNGAALNDSADGLPNNLPALAGALSSRLSAWTGNSLPEGERAALLQAFNAINDEMLRLESTSSQRMDALLQRQRIQYGVGWLLALAAMVLLGLGVFHNNRALRAAQTALQDNDTQLHRMLDMLPQLVWICDANARMSYMNHRWSEYTGIPMEQLLAEGWGPLVHPDDVPPLVSQWGEVVNSGARTLPEFRIRRSDGVYRWFCAYFEVSQNEEGQPQQWFGSSVDVDEVHNARAALEYNAKFYRETLDALGEGVVTLDRNRRVTACNPAAERLLGLSRSNLLNLPQTLWEITLRHEDGRPMGWDETPTAQVFASGVASHDVLIQVTLRNGSECSLLVTAEPIRGPDGEIHTVVSSFRDVTDRRRTQLELRQYQEGLQRAVELRTQELTAEIGARALAEEQLQELNHQLQEAERFSRLVADNIPAWVTYWDQDVRCLFANKAYCEWFGETHEQIVGRTMVEARGEAYYQSLEPFITAALRGEPQIFERSDYSREGDLVVSRGHYIPDVHDGVVRGYFVLAVDITPQKKSEQILMLARDQANAASQAKSAFLANMSHEIRTPMNAIIGFTYMLRREVQDPVQQQRLARIGTASNHLLQVINDILDLSKIEAGKLVLENVDFSLDALLTRSCSMIAESAHGKGLELVVDIAPLPDRLYGDPTRLMQALLNLLGNAVKFTEQGSISLRVVMLEQQGDEMLLRFDVVDTGVGIAAQEMAHLFDPFAQAQASSSRLHLGTGLGLAITRHIAEQMGGEAGGESEPGAGSRFWFTARLVRAASQEDAAALPLRGLRALVADDLLEARQAMAAMLASFQVRVDTVADGTQALDAYAKAQDQGDHYDIVLLDWAMPGIDGLETGQRIADSLHPPKALVLVSTRDHSSMHQLARDAGFGAALMKPLTPSILLDCLVRLLQHAGQPQHTPDPSLPVTYQLDEHHQGARILLVEDNPVNQEVAIQLLQSAGVVVDVANDGLQGVQMAHAKPYDLILMDVQMPRMDGLQATRLLREDPALADLPIIALTANALAQDKQACMEAGMNDHLAKPVDPRLLHQALVRWLPARSRADMQFARASAPAPLMAMPDAAPAAPPATTPAAPAAGVSPEQKLARMAALIDLASAYEYCAGQAPILMSVMLKFVAHYRDAGSQLEQQLAAGDKTAAARLLHSLRGVSATLGATQILEATRALENTLKTGTPEEQSPAALAAPAKALRHQLETLVTELAVRLED